MAGMATMGNGRQTTTPAAMAANRSKTMAPNLPAEDPTRVSKMGGRYLFQKYLRVGRERKVCSQDSSPVFLPRGPGPPPLVLLSLFVRRIILSAHRPKVFSLLVWLVARINRVAKSTKVWAEINY